MMKISREEIVRSGRRGEEEEGDREGVRGKEGGEGRRGVGMSDEYLVLVKMIGIGSQCNHVRV